ncbi:MAG: S9 family peptidase [Planctomycetota bacterium]|jgi:dipeptidyl aminopeptidase/acylaminoacyl peptidase
MTMATRLAAPSIAALLLLSHVNAQQVVLSQENYLSPPAVIADVITSDAMHNPENLRNLSPDGKHFMVNQSRGMTPLDDMARPYVNLGETAIDHVANRSRRMSQSNTVGIKLVSHKTGERRWVNLPGQMTITGAQWSPDGSKIAFIGNHDDASYLYVAEVESGEARKVTERALNASLVGNFRWAGDSNQLLAVLIPEGRGPMPQRPVTATEPTVWMSNEGETPTRTYRFLLKSPYDKDLLEYLTTSQLAVMNCENGEVHNIGSPAMYTSIDISPDAQHFRVTTMQRPFSYFAPRSSFGTKEEIIDEEGMPLNMLNERKFVEGQRRGGGRGRGGNGNGNGGRRSLSWRPDGKGMSFLQLEPKPEKPAEEKKDDDAKKGDAGKPDDKPAAAATPANQNRRTGNRRAGNRAGRRGGARRGGARRGGNRAARRGGAQQQRPAQAQAQSSDAPQDAEKKEEEEKPRKDRIMQWLPPFDEDSAKVVWESEDPIQSVQYSQDCQTLYITQTKDGKRRLFAVNLKDPKKELLIQETDANQGGGAGRGGFRGRGRRGGGGGAGLSTKPGKMGGRIVRTSTDGKSVYMAGSDEPKEGEEGTAKPFMDKIALASGEKERIWEGSPDHMDSISAILDDDLNQLVINRQTATDVPNDHLLDRDNGRLRQLTDNIDPAPEVTGAERHRFQVTRVDGIKFWVNVTIPRGYGRKLPALFWFYPREYTSQEAYDQRTRKPNPNRFPAMRNRSMQLMTLAGYAVVEPDCPIIGKEGRMNDNYVADLRNSLWAVIDELDKREMIDRDRLALGGHSYGAFSTANAMAHTPFFKAGIAGDGNYNRTLTPMSFQSERRSFWDARETYTSMSPLFWANQVNGALLMYHGADDANTGTFPINSPRMFQALNGLGKDVALYVYPYEAHGPAGAETILDMWARWVEWLDIHVKYPERANEKYQKAKAPDLTEDK